MRLCVIPARGGSKRIPRKNIKMFNGKPMISYSIETALESGCFDKVVVSTDDEEIAQVARDYGAEVPFIRPDELSGDFAGTTPVIKHAVEWFEAQGIQPEYVCCIYATAPFVKAKRLVAAFEQLIETQAEYCFSVTSFPYPIQRAFKLTDNQRLEMFNSEHFDTRSQDLQEAYHDAGQFYWGTADAFKQNLQVFSEFSSPYILPRHLVQDIDTHEDMVRAELMYQLIEQKEMW